MNEKVMEAEYPFITDNIILSAVVHPNGHQELVMKCIDPTTKEVLNSDSIPCIHTAVMDLSVDEFDKIHENSDSEKEFHQKIINIRSSEHLREINLSLEDKFLAFKSWVAGIAESGMDALNIQADIDNALGLQYPIMEFIFRFLVVNNLDFLGNYLSKVEKEHQYDGVSHGNSIKATLAPVIKTLCNEPELKIKDFLRTINEIIQFGDIFEIYRKKTIQIKSGQISGIKIFHDFMGEGDNTNIKFTKSALNGTWIVYSIEPLRGIATYYMFHEKYDIFTPNNDRIPFAKSDFTHFANYSGYYDASFGIFDSSVIDEEVPNDGFDSGYASPFSPSQDHPNGYYETICEDCDYQLAWHNPAWKNLFYNKQNQVVGVRVIRRA